MSASSRQMGQFENNFAESLYYSMLELAPLSVPENKSVIDLEFIFESAQSAGVSSETFYQTFAITLGTRYLERVETFEPSAKFFERIPIGFARQHAIIGAASDGTTSTIYAADLRGFRKLDTIRRRLSTSVEVRFTTADEVERLINHAYQQKSSQTETFIESFDRETVLQGLDQSNQRADLLDDAGQSPVIKLINMILFDAVRNDASDIHIQPYEDRLVVRFRIDGVLFDQFDVPRSTQEEAISRVKVMANMNIAEKRLPQDGRATVQVGDRLIDLRIASLPTSFGERVVIRLLDKSARLYTLSELGMSNDILESFQRLIHLEHGMILVTGPTGGGKSTTLYAALQEINSTDRNVVTLEDPIEYQLTGISQTQINEKKGMTFATGLRSILRQDPDIIMVGEIRDQETAEMAIQSALTGHMVFSTLHTNDAASAVTRLLDLGIEPYLVASSVVGVLAQRLVRRVCEECKTTDRPEQEQLRACGLDPTDSSWHSVVVGKGCSTCRQTGYRGRVGLFELMPVEDSLGSLIQTRENASHIRAQAMKLGMRLLREDGLAKVKAGETTLEEVMRVSMLERSED